MLIIEILLFCFLFQFSFGQSTDPNDEQILMDWYNSLESKGTLNWTGINDLCLQTANQIYCDSSTKRVTRIVLNGYGFQGTISNEFGNLTQLQQLDLDTNQLNGPIPTELGNLKQLYLLDLDTNQLNGTIPTELGYLTLLQVLFLYENQLNGTIPTELENLTLLQWLYLYSNQLNGTIPTQLGNLKQLEYLALSYTNQLNGPIPTELGNLPQLIWLDLSYNQLNGTIPTELGNLIQLQTLELNDNQLNGPIPTHLGNLTQLIYLYLEDNQLIGTIPTELGNLIQLTDLVLSNNQLTGTIPTQLGNLTLLQILAFDNNQLTGTIPTQLGNLTQLQYLYLNNNQLTGTIPTQLLSLPLYLLYLASNYWDCPILNYSSISNNDYGIAKSDCDLSCLPNPCLNEGQCSTRLNGSYHCECLPLYYGINCTNALPKSLIALYSFSTINKSLDGTGNGHDLISFKTESMNYPRTDDPTNQALIFFGNDVISTSPSSPPFTLGDTFSVSVLFSISKFYLTSSLILFTPTDIYGIPSFNLMIYPSGSIQVSLNGKVVLRTANSIISLNTLYLVTLIKNGNVMRIFRNGEPVATITNSPLINISNNMMYLAYNFIGILDEVSIYSSPLSKVEIQNQVNQLSLPTKACGGCLNGGICGKIEGGKQCFCSQCFSGNLCEIKMDGCENPCKNGGINVGGVCQCAAGFTGPTCSSYVTCNAFNNSTGIFSQGTAYKGATGTCPGGKNGNPTSQCLHDGTWRTILSPCN